MQKSEIRLLYYISWRRQWHPTPALLPGKSHGRRSLVGCSPRGRWGSDRTERLHFHFSLSCIGEGNGNPLQFSCLENPRDWGASWATVYGVTQTQTQLKRLSSSSSSITLVTKISSKFIRDFNKISEIVKTLEESIGKNLHVPVGTDFFLNMMPKAQ